MNKNSYFNSISNKKLVNRFKKLNTYRYLLLFENMKSPFFSYNFLIDCYLITPIFQNEIMKIITKNEALLNLGHENEIVRKLCRKKLKIKE